MGNWLSTGNNKTLEDVEASTLSPVSAPGVDVNAKYWRGYSALYYAVYNNDLESSRLLLEHGAQLDIYYEDFSAFAVVTRRGETRNLAANRSECFSLWREMHFLGQKALAWR